ncbi:MAG: hypothetical protein AAFP02_23955, partial [Bacteroidota bacterium]
MKTRLLYFLSIGVLILACKSRPIPAITSEATYLYYVPAHDNTYLIDQTQRYLYQWRGKEVLRIALGKDEKRISLPGFVNLDEEKVLWGPAIDSSLIRELVGKGRLPPPFNQIEFQQSLTRARRDKQYKRLMRETIAEIEAGYLVNVRQFLDTFFIENPNDVEAHYAEALWFARRNRV